MVQFPTNEMTNYKITQWLRSKYQTQEDTINFEETIKHIPVVYSLKSK